MLVWCAGRLRNRIYVSCNLQSPVISRISLLILRNWILWKLWTRDCDVTVRNAKHRFSVFEKPQAGQVFAWAHNRLQTSQLYSNLAKIRYCSTFHVSMRIDTVHGASDATQSLAECKSNVCDIMASYRRVIHWNYSAEMHEMFKTNLGLKHRLPNLKLRGRPLVHSIPLHSTPLKVLSNETFLVENLSFGRYVVLHMHVLL